VNPEEIKRFLKATPFVLFSEPTSDGKHLEVKHPELAFLTRMMLFVGEGVADPTADIPDRANSVSRWHVVWLGSLVAA
jgi:hypothetical protein